MMLLKLEQSHMPVSRSDSDSLDALSLFSVTFSGHENSRRDIFPIFNINQVVSVKN